MDYLREIKKTCSRLGVGGIMLVEFISGSFLRLFSLCPWDYSKTPYNISGLVRLDYFPVWFTAGLIFEYILSQKKKHILS